MWRDPDTGIVDGEASELLRALHRAEGDLIDAQAHGHEDEAEWFHGLASALHEEAKRQGLLAGGPA